MLFLKILAWIFVPFFMIIFQWEQLSAVGRLIGFCWAAFFMGDLLITDSRIPGIWVLFGLAILLIFIRIPLLRSASRGASKSSRGSIFRYVTGHPNLKPGFVLVEKTDIDGILTIGGNVVRVLNIEWIPRETQETRVTKRGRSGFGGALAGALIAGPFGMVTGAIVRKKAPTVGVISKDNSLSVLSVEMGSLSVPVYFACDANEHQRLASLL